MTYRRQMLAVLAGFLLAAAWASEASAHPASHATQHPVVVDSTNYQSEEQLLANTQVMVVAKVESAAIDRSAPASQPALLVTLEVHDVLRGHVGRMFVVAQPGAARPQAGPVVPSPLRRGHTYLLLLARSPGAGAFFLVGGNAGEFSYSGTTRRFTKLDTSAPWEISDFPLTLAKAGAAALPESTEPSWLNPGGPAGPQTVSWSSMANDLGMSLTDVSCPSEDLCLFAGEVTPPDPGVEVPAVAASNGPFTPQANVRRDDHDLCPHSDSTSDLRLVCGCGSLRLVVRRRRVCHDGPHHSALDARGCAITQVLLRAGVLPEGLVLCGRDRLRRARLRVAVERPSAWNYIHIGTVGQAISCPSPQLALRVATATPPWVAGSKRQAALWFLQAGTAVRRRIPRSPHSTAASTA